MKRTDCAKKGMGRKKPEWLQTHATKPVRPNDRRLRAFVRSHA